MSVLQKRGPGRPRVSDEATQQFNIRLTESQVGWLDEQSRRAGGSGRNAVIRRLIDEARERERG